MGREGEPWEYIGAYKDGVFDRLLPLYKSVVKYLPLPHEADTIVDLGCGIGMFTEVVFKAGYTKYIGIDFSPTMIGRSKKRVPEAKFIIGDLRDKETQKIIENYKIFVSLEVLEHIENDLDIIAAIPVNSLVIFSVPNFGGEFHVRHFNSEIEVIKRYNKLLRFDKYITIGNGVKRFLFKGIRY